MSHLRAPRLTALVTILLFGLLLRGERVGSHVPITTRITFNREVVRTLRTHCLGCHSPQGIKSDLPLLTYGQARPWAKAIKEEILNRRMAPYQVVKGYGNFKHDYLLAPREQDQLIAWIEGGVPKGEEKDYPAGLIAQLNGPPEWANGEPDQILQPASTSQIPPVPFTGRRCHSIPVRNETPRSLSLIDFRPDNGQVVHAASIDLAPSGGIDGCRLPEGQLIHLADWVPGQRSHLLPSGMAQRLPSRATIVLRIDYRGKDGPTTDRSHLGLYFAKDQVSHLIERRTIRTTLPARGPRIAVDQVLREERQIVAIRPLIPSGADSLEARLIQPDGSSEVLIFSRNFRFDWRPTYHFRIPRPAPAGSRISITAYTASSNSPVLCQIVTARAVDPAPTSTSNVNIRRQAGRSR